jgi:hypothetical protein
MQIPKTFFKFFSILVLLVVVSNNTAFSQLLHSSACPSISTNFSLDWDLTPTGTQFNWGANGTTSFTANNIQGTGNSIAFSITGATGTLTNEGGKLTPSLNTTLSGGAEALHISSSGLTSTQKITVTMTFTPALAGNIAFDLYNIRRLVGGGAGQQLEVYGLTSTGYALVPELTNNGSPSWELEGPGVVDGNASSNAGTNDQVGIAFKSISDISTITIVLRRCATCGNATNTEFAIGDIDICLTPDTDQDGISDTKDEDDDNDGILDVIEKCAPSTPVVAEWDNMPYTNGDPSNTYALPDGTNMTVAIASNGASIVTGETNTNLTGGNGGGTVGLFLNGNQNLQVNSIDVSFKWDQVIDDLSYTIFDVDQLGGQYIDSITIIGFYNGFVVFPAMTGSANNTVTTNRAEGDVSTADNLATANVDVQFSEPIDSMIIFYGNGSNSPAAPGNQWVTIWDFTYVGDCGSTDSDGDGVDDYLDIDADNDGIVDNIERQGSTGSPINPSGVDLNTNGIDDNYESNPVSVVDTDGDGIPDFKDPDSDNDGDLDLIEGWDTNNDGIANTLPQGTDPDGDGLDGLANLSGFDDQNGWNSTSNITNNGQTSSFFPNLDEVGTTERDWREDNDFDGDGIQNYADIDDDNDGILDINEGRGSNNPSGDEDGDGIQNWSDATDNGNGGDGSITNYTDSNSDGIPDVYDVDFDGLPNHMDLDSDGDGIADIVEAGGVDSDGNGIVDGGFTDTDGDGWSNTFDADNGGTALTDVDQDADGKQNHLDIDADNDGIPDIIESQASGALISPSGSDADEDGIDNNFDADFSGSNRLTNPVNTDAVDNPDYIDSNSDNDVDTDQVEGWDTNNNGTANTLPSGVDTDNDGLDNNFDNYNMLVLQNYATNATDNGKTSASFPDLDTPGGELDWRSINNTNDNDGDGILNADDIDDDNDGILDIDESECSAAVNATSSGIGSYTAVADGIITVSINGGDGGGAATRGGSGATINATFSVLNGDIIRYVVGAGSGAASGGSAGGAGSTGLFINNTLMMVAGGGAGGDNSGGGVGLGASATTSGFNGTGTTPGSGGAGGNGGTVGSSNAGAGAGINSNGGSSNAGGGTAADLVPGNGVTFVAGGASNGGGSYSAGGGGFTGGGGGSSGAYSGGGGGYSGGGAAGGSGGAGGGGSYLNTGSASYISGSITAGATGAGGAVNGAGAAGFVTISVCNSVDSDNDGVRDSYDLDSDGDGIADIVEAGGIDTDGNGIVDGAFNDGNNSDGWSNVFDNQNGSGGTPLVDVDTDGDGLEDRIDLDSDGDGIIDIIESQPTGILISPSGIDADGDGIDDNFDTNEGNSLTTPHNTDGTDNPDYSDTDSDNDGDPDSEEGWDSDNDGNANTNPAGADADGDGIDDNFDNIVGPNNTTNITNGGQSSGIFPNLDRTGTPELDWREDFDNDNDGITDENDIDDDNDGIPDSEECDASIIFEGGFEGIAGLNTGVNNLGVDISPWILTSGGTNVIKVDGAGGTTYGIGGPEFDARGGAGNYFDVNGTGSIYQTFVVTTTQILFYEGFFSARDGASGTGDISIRSGTGIGGSIISTTGTLTTSDNVNWSYTSNSVTLTPGTYSYVVTMSNPINFDEGAIIIICDSDNDGIPNQYDLDSDGDGIADIIEAGGVDADGNGIVDDETDSNNDGWANTFDPINGGTPLADLDTDADGLKNRVDIDADDDGIIDIIESQISGTLIIPSGIDSDGDGIDNNFDPDLAGSLTVPTNTDGTDNPDYTDTNSDNDGQSDLKEAWDTDNDGTADTNPAGTDTDGDGLDDNFDDVVGPNNTTNVTNNGQSSSSFPNLDNGNTSERDWREIQDADSDGVADEFDVDDDNDGILDVNEGLFGNNPAGDEDGDGILNYLDVSDGGNGGDGSTTNYTDGDGNGMPDVFDTDGDGVPNHFDLDSDDDGIADIIEAGGVDTDGDGSVDGVFMDGINIDGWSQVFDIADGGTALPVTDTDGDGLENYLDLDSDTDGILDNIEGQTTLGFRSPLNADVDGDGWDDEYDGDVTNGTNGTPIVLSNNDGAGDPDYIDGDTDGDGLVDWMEGFDDNNSEDALDDFINRADAFELGLGNPLYYVSALDTDLDGIPNFLEDDNINGIPNFADPASIYFHDTDNDGLSDFVDPDNGGTPSLLPDGDGDAEYDFRDTDNSITLPISLLSFEAEKQFNSVILTWATLSEINNDFFTIEKSKDGEQFEFVGTVRGAGNSLEKLRYELIDPTPFSGVSYYRLKQTDFNGEFTYSELRAVEFVNSNIVSESNIYPNPTNGDQLYFNLNSLEKGDLELQIRTMKGELVKTRLIVLDGMDTNYEFELLKGTKLAVGTYMVTYLMNDKIIGTKRFIVN